MNVNAVLMLLGGLVIVALALGVVIRATQTRVRTAKPGATAEILEIASIDADRFGGRLTLVQFSTETCSRCPATARTLRAASEPHEGVAHIEVDVTHRDDLIKRFSILRTPTVLVLDEHRRLRSRVSGPIGISQAQELLNEHLAHPERSYA